MARVLVMIPSGEVYDHDSVRWYQHSNVQRNINHYHNIGDAFVFEFVVEIDELRKARRIADHEIRTWITSIACGRNMTM